ncbi:MAG: hypothetical protein EXQ56_14020 [Acidobacteria bacterium]|nr:hypothetical protein [Acidobacteriota bacterium]
MGEYYRDSNNQIQADMAYRLGIIAGQYSSLPLPEDKNFSSTLDLCILQNLLTNCVELLKAMSRNERHTCDLTADLATRKLWGLNPGMIKDDTFWTKRLTAEVVLKRIRNAVSHPTCTDLNRTFPSSGYTTIPDGSGKIHEYCFVNSPDTRENEPKSFPTAEKARAYIKKGKDEGDMPEDVTVITKDMGKFGLSQNGSTFARVFKIHLTSQEIHALVMGLSNHLAQPKQESWDGSTINTSLITSAILAQSSRPGVLGWQHNQ